ncbi:DNA-directed RNA polymerase subunit beta [Mycoplasmoides fastidiosum]|uniref:DNA-directed RNA polymerase subunit beta n=3 Tax=Mycoplasmoides fastidiosum TaxID=92758 RepID=A0ABU0LZL9_9BACT|nr:DNA-directed RNA polymerase subunit beta [Mycoplasmoides fastidiosum]MDQ0514035.1 DNA-directed RNA polymerase subunit beta [Mycoplasmoides fastidiosum]UUD37555.1 DNA-directed RNA polymerase subunit beta [Mycoplasmoides fastidiosum]
MNNQKPFFIDEISNLVSRRNYSKIPHSQKPPSLVGIQSQSYRDFINVELKRLIQNNFPIVSNSENLELHFNKIVLRKPEITEFDAWEQSKTYQASLYVQLSLLNKETGEVKILGSKKNKNSENLIFFGDIPLMTEKGTFIVNGIEKFVISQIVRAPGAYMLTKSQLKLSNSRKKIQEGTICELLPLKGALILFYIPEGHRQIRVLARSNSGESAAQFSSSTLLKGLGLTEQQFLAVFENNDFATETLSGESFNATEILNDPDIQEILAEISQTPDLNELLKEHENRLDLRLYELLVKFHNRFGDTYNQIRNQLLQRSVEDSKYSVLQSDLRRFFTNANSILELICIERAAKHIITQINISYKIAKTATTSYQELLWNYFFEKRMYDMGKVGRYKLNRKLRISERLYRQILAQDIKDIDGKIVFPKGTLMLKDEIQKFKKLSYEHKLDIIESFKLNHLPKKFKNRDLYREVSFEKIRIFENQEENSPILTLIGVPDYTSSDSISFADLLSVFSYLSHIDKEIGSFDDIDHLGNKRMRLISELLCNRIQIALLRIEKFIREKMAASEVKMKNISLKNEGNTEQISVKSLINTKPFQIIIKEFFNSHQLTQFIDQQNPLSELTNKRRISAMGPGGINRDDPNLDIRDVHYSNYGRICPIETPEGMNIGLIMSLATYSQIDELGFITSPYYKVRNGVITDEIHWLTALREDEYVITEAISPRDKKNKLLSPVNARYRSFIESFEAKDVDYIDVNPCQVVSISTASIPFLENDDANRALMGANMQRQATPLLRPYAPIVGTGLEYPIARDSGMALVAEEDGIVVAADGESLSVRYENLGVNRCHHLVKFKRSNQDTSNTQTPIVRAGEAIQKGQVLADGPAMQNGELALGQNVLVAFTTWSGYNYEDAIVLSSRLVQDDLFTSIHIDEHTIECLRTKNGDEEITRQIPNISDDAKRYLDEDGVIIVGAEVYEGDILVGKTSPKAQVEQSSEEKLLQAIFSEKVKQVKDSSLKVPHGGEGVVAAVKRFSVQSGNELNDDVIEIIKVFVAQKRKIQMGDKMAGRHGNKGIVSRIVPMEDMPHLEDGTPVDILLNPLGVPSRMNIGQVLEMHLGLAGRKLVLRELIKAYFNNTPTTQIGQMFGLRETNVVNLLKNFKEHIDEININTEKQALEKLSDVNLTMILKQTGLLTEDLIYKISTPVFSGVNHTDLIEIMKEAGLDPTINKGKFDLYDGRTGEKFERPISVGISYMLKLDHMVDDKIHARSVGPYSKITQQPLGGKSQNGGQRFGEMEVWALEAYGAAYNLRELLTVKSDDVQARNAVYSAIIKGRKLPQPLLPESFKLLVKKLEGLCFRINIQYGQNSKLMNSYEFLDAKTEENQIYKNTKTEAIVDGIDEVNSFSENEIYRHEELELEEVPLDELEDDEALLFDTETEDDDDADNNNHLIDESVEEEN